MESNVNKGELAIFENNDLGNLRAINIDGEPWFVAKDACDALGLENVGQACSTLDDDEKNTITINDGIRGNPNMLAISESGLYALIFKSRKPEAKAFRKWVTCEVLPSIRKTGKYTAPTADNISVDEKLRLANKMLDIANVSKTMRLLVMGDIIHNATGFNAIEACHMNLPRASGEPVLTPKEIAQALGPDFGD